MRSIRRRVAAVGATVFLGVWGVVCVRLVEGHDPGLAQTAAAATATSYAADADSSAAAVSASSTAAAATPTAVTTRQS